MKGKNNLTKIKAIILSLIIAIVLTSFVVYLVESIRPGPEYDDYCGDVRGPKTDREIPVEPEKVTQESCVAEGGRWNNGGCDYQYYCQKEYDDARDKHQLIVFLVAVPVGLIAVGVGIVLGLPSVSSGLMLGGVFLTIYGTSNYWSNFSNWVKALILGIVLLVLIWLGYKKLEN
ncbi:hypothetical protein CMI38_02280 [Candidatus Pacearchaeota archaeon]|mgnify:CR=1 FL=1|jgi:hypothetical protein|nr:hypothetical protein [Candidatus Pacearchaeota archaeon]|tara:strand:+ start:824 stop:1345 length:522 start_codon:yes stop_codon:yes gene_type:complete